MTRAAAENFIEENEILPKKRVKELNLNDLKKKMKAWLAIHYDGSSFKTCDQMFTRATAITAIQKDLLYVADTFPGGAKICEVDTKVVKMQLVAQVRREFMMPECSIPSSLCVDMATNELLVADFSSCPCLQA